MTEKKSALSPKTDEVSAPKQEYNDLKYPLLQRGIPVPSGLEDYIRARTQRDMLTDTEIETIRKEMLQVFQAAGQDVPSDFEKNFEEWFPRS